jgi:hypothetical protein
MDAGLAAPHPEKEVLEVAPVSPGAGNYYHSEKVQKKVEKGECAYILIRPV